MRLIAKKTLLEFAQKYPDAKRAIENFASIAEAAKWRGMDEIVQLGVFRASPINNERIVFNIGANKYRLICAVLFQSGIVFVKWYGTHAEYDRIDAATATMFDR